MDQISPHDKFPIVRLIEDPFDTNTYYVRAVVRDGRTDELLETVDLEDQGDNRHSKIWRAVGDPDGSGRYINITTTVYTDEDHTTKSERYAEQIREYVIYPRRVGFGGGGSSAPIDYKRLERMIDDKLNKAIDNIKIPKPVKPVDHTEELNKIRSSMGSLSLSLANVIESVQSINIPEPEKVDLQPVMSQIQTAVSDINSSIANIEIPKPEVNKQDVRSIIRAIGDTQNMVAGVRTNTDNIGDVVRRSLADFFGNVAQNNTEPKPEEAQPTTFKGFNFMNRL